MRGKMAAALSLIGLLELCSLALADAAALKFKAILNTDGTISLQPVDQASSSTPSPAVIGTYSPDKKVIAWKDSVGDLKAFYFIPSNGNLPRDVIASMAPGDTLVASAASDFAKDIQQKMLQSLKDLLNETRQAVCDLDPRPTQISAQVEMGGSIGITANVTVNATWNTSDMCK